MDNLTYTIQQRNKKDTKSTNSWLKNNGVNAEKIADTHLYLLQAQIIATNILKNNSNLLGPNEAHTLNKFLVAMRRPQNVKKAQAHKVMKIGTSINRKIFKAIKKADKQLL